MVFDVPVTSADPSEHIHSTAQRSPEAITNPHSTISVFAPYTLLSFRCTRGARVMRAVYMVVRCLHRLHSSTRTLLQRFLMLLLAANGMPVESPALLAIVHMQLIPSGTACSCATCIISYFHSPRYLHIIWQADVLCERVTSSAPAYSLVPWIRNWDAFLKQHCMARSRTMRSQRAPSRMPLSVHFSRDGDEVEFSGQADDGSRLGRVGFGTCIVIFKARFTRARLPYSGNALECLPVAPIWPPSWRQD